MIVLSLAQNFALLVTLLVVHQMLLTSPPRSGAMVEALSGLLFGAVGLVGMMTPVPFSPGIIFDGRSIILCAAGLFGGPIPAAVSAIICGAYRLHLGGGGVIMGVSVIVESAALGVLFRRLSLRRPSLLRPLPLLGLGLLVHAVMLALTLLLPPDEGAKVRRNVGPYILTLYPLATMLVCWLFVIFRDRRAAAAALARSEQLYRSYVDNAPYGVFVVNETGRCVEVNPQACRVTGRGAEELLNMDVQSLLPPEARDLCLNHIRKTLEQGQAATEVPFVRKSGERGWWSVTSVRLSPTRLLGFADDITSRRESQEALRQSQALLAAIINALPAPVFYKNQQGRYLGCNDAFARFLGLPRQDIVGRTPSDIAPSDLAHIYHQADLDIMTQGASQVYETEVAPAVGERRQVVFHKAPFRHGDGAIAGIVGAMLDITERKKAEEALRESEEKFRSIAEQLTDMVFLADERGVISYVSPASQRLFGCAPSAMTGRLFTEFLPPEEMERALAAFQDALAGKSLENLVLRMKRGDGSFFNGEVNGARSNLGGQKGTLGLIRDVTARLALEEQLRQAQKMEAVGRLAGGVAHDFNNTLQVITGSVDLILAGAGPQNPYQEDLIEIRNAARRSVSLTRQLLAYARKQTVSPVPLNLNEFVPDMLKMLRRLIGEDIEIAWIPGQDLGLVMLDPSQAGQILSNLAVNARDAINGPGKITIETMNVVLDEAFRGAHPGCSPGPHVVLSVTDSGCGMDKKTLDHIFDPFFTTKPSGQGAGLGLATVYGIVRQNNGVIHVESKPGKGARFSVYLPRLNAPAAPPPAPVSASGASAERKGGTETILLVEDERTILFLTSRVLSNLGYKVLQANTPGEALRLATSHPGPIHLLLTDVVMPGMNGRELSQRLAELKPGVKCLYMSGYTADVIANQGILTPGVHFIEKPFAPSELAAKARQILDATDPQAPSAS